MPIAEWFLKHYNSDVTGVGKSPLRKRFSKFRQSRVKYRETRITRKRRFAGGKKLQEKKMKESTEKERAALPIRLMSGKK